ncbi:Protein of unknown function [Alteromonadaceae bacterium Bs31]|nr:Protein of unknown function [Alteromonadaceae bacterium Bs31]
MELGIYGQILFWVLVIGVFSYELLQIAKGKASEKWRKHPAKIVEVSIETREDDGTEESQPRIKYQYYYMGKMYKGSKVKYGNLWSTKYGEASKLVSGLVNGSEITVYVNPNRPNQSVLYRGYEGNVIWLFVFIGIVIYAVVKS